MPFSLNGGELMSDNELYKSIKVQEHIDIVDVVKAYTILYHAQVNNTYDIYLFLASINLLNTYVKQNKKAISYSFKSRIFFINELITYIQRKNSYICLWYLMFNLASMVSF